MAGYSNLNRFAGGNIPVHDRRAEVALHNSHTEEIVLLRGAFGSPEASFSCNSRHVLTPSFLCLTCHFYLCRLWIYNCNIGRQIEKAVREKTKMRSSRACSPRRKTGGLVSTVVERESLFIRSLRVASDTHGRDVAAYREAEHKLIID